MNPGDWNARFVKWKKLGAAFDPLQTILAQSPGIGILKTPRVLPSFADAAFDDVDDRDLILAKSALLNLRMVLGRQDPISARPWLAGMRQILNIGRQRFIGVVDQPTWLAVSTLANGGSAEYHRAPAGEHVGNYPPQYRFSPNQIVSIKSTDETGNLQLTIVPATDPAGNAVFLLDTDIDENGKWILHAINFVAHWFYGGTHPFDVHQILTKRAEGEELGYILVESSGRL